jgi:hypothetical protein
MRRKWRRSGQRPPQQRGGAPETVEARVTEARRQVADTVAALRALEADPDVEPARAVGQPLNGDRPRNRRPATPTCVLNSDLDSNPDSDSDLWSRRTRDASRVRHDSSSLERRRGRRGSTVVQTIVGTMQCPMLPKTNYTEWSSVMKVKLQVRQMWDAV